MQLKIEIKLKIYIILHKIYFITGQNKKIMQYLLKNYLLKVTFKMLYRLTYHTQDLSITKLILTQNIL